MIDFRARFETEGLTDQLVESFRETIYEYYRGHERKLPWRSTRDPYRILVSEFMLQQTQVERVIAKYDFFLGSFPDIYALAKAELREVLAVWQGLGYNRRALALQRTAIKIVSEYGGTLPHSADTLTSFPGIGKATAGAIIAFAFNRPAVFIETNIRRVFIHFFFPEDNRVSDRTIFPLVEATLDVADVRKWYYALMDYGAMLKGMKANPNRRSAHYKRQPPFQGSDRRIRGLVLKTLLGKDKMTEQELLDSIQEDESRTSAIIALLVQERFLDRTGNVLTIARGSKDLLTES